MVGGEKSLCLSSCATMMLPLPEAAAATAARSSSRTSGSVSWA